MPPKKATTGKSTATDVSGKGVLTRSQDLRRAADACETPLEREGAPPPLSSVRGNGLEGAEAGNHGPNGPVEDGVEPGAPPVPPPPQQPRAGLRLTPLIHAERGSILRPQPVGAQSQGCPASTTATTRWLC